MLLSQHVVAGGAVGLAMGNPVLAFIMGLVSHHLLDLIPHVDNNIFNHYYMEIGDYTLAFVDLLVVCLIIYKIWPKIRKKKRNLFVWGLIGSVLPDVITNVPLWHKEVVSSQIGASYYHFHMHFHGALPSTSLGIYLAIALQVLITLGGLWAFSRD